MARPSRRRGNRAADPPVMGRRARRRTNRSLAISGSIALLALAVMLWKFVDAVVTDLVVYVPAAADNVTTTNWVNDLRDAGYHVHVVSDADPARRREILHIPQDLAAQVCAVTANPSRYVFSGYVPPHAIARLLSEQPALHGLSIPDSPELSATINAHAPVAFDVWAHRSDGRRQLYVPGTFSSGR
jgi:hypothetical protein